MSTVGYGDYSPTTDEDIILCLFIMVITCGLFAYLINRVSEIFSEMYRFQSEVRKNMKIINNYMKKKNITFSM